jgi:hypothetical protein
MFSAHSLDSHLADDAWAWWQSKRLGYNLALAAAGWAAYGLTVALHIGFNQPLWPDWRGAVSMTLFLGIGFLVVMGAANVFYLLGPAIESLVKPTDSGRFRRAAHGMGFWGSMALPFAFPVVNLAALIAGFH